MSHWRKVLQNHLREALVRLLTDETRWSIGTVLEKMEIRLVKLWAPEEPANEHSPAGNTDLAPPSSMSFLCPLLTKLNIELHGKEQTIKGSHSFF